MAGRLDNADTPLITSHTFPLLFIHTEEEEKSLHVWLTHTFPDKSYYTIWKLLKKID